MASEDIAHLQHSSHFTLAELEALYRRFEILDRDRSGTLSIEEVLGIPEFAMNPLAPRVIELLGLGEEELDFTRFIHLLSLFHQRASRADKLRLAFRMYNLSGDGFIKREELAQVLGMMAGHEIADDELASIIDHILLELDLNGDERIDFDEFSLVMSKSNSVDCLTFSF